MKEVGGSYQKADEMKEEKKQMLEELCSAGKWTEFLNALPINRGDTYRFKTSGQILTLRVIAAQQSRKAGATRQYSVKAVDFENLTAFVEATSKRQDGNL